MDTLIPIGELKTHCYQILENATHTDNKLIITKRGKPIATITPIKEVMPKRSLFGIMKGAAKINDDLISSINVKWDAENTATGGNS